MVDVGAEKNRAQWTHHETYRECRHREHQRCEFAARGEISAADGGTEIAEHHEIVHFEEISARDADDRVQLLLALWGRQHPRSVPRPLPGGGGGAFTIF